MININFVKTSSEDVYGELKNAGFTYLGKEGDLYCFINDGKQLTFSEDNKKKILYTNMICLENS